MRRQTCHVIVASHNRRSASTASISSLLLQEPHPLALDLTLYADGCTDGTQESIQNLWPNATVIEGSGQEFWAKSMHLAEHQARATNPDFILWLNDDVVLDSDALMRLAGASLRNPNSIVVGALRSSRTFELTYGGRSLSRGGPLKFRTMAEQSRDQFADGFHGNLVLVPRTVGRRLGPIDGRFAHAFADDDYSHRARRARIPIVVAPGTIGTCDRHDDDYNSLTLRAAWTILQSPKGLPLRSHWLFMKKHAPLGMRLYWTIRGQLGFLIRAVRRGPESQRKTQPRT